MSPIPNPVSLADIARALGSEPASPRFGIWRLVRQTWLVEGGPPREFTSLREAQLEASHLTAQNGARERYEARAIGEVSR